MKPDYERGNVKLWNRDCLEWLPTLEAGLCEVVITDPPYGVGKAEWDELFPTAWYTEARRVCSGTIFTMPGNSMLPDCIRMVGDDYRDVFVLWLSNGMTLGPASFGNWIPVVVSQSVKRHLGGQNLLRVVVNTTKEKIDHPSPKPFDAMLKLVGTHTEPDDTVLDCYLGSGTTGVACVRLSRSFLGCEIDPKYFDLACRRIDAAFDSLALIDPTPPAVRQGALFAEEQ